VSAGKERAEKGTYAHAYTAVAFLNIFMAFGKGPFGLECHCYVPAVAAACVGLAVFDIRRRFRACERSGFVAWVEGFAVESEIYDLVRVHKGSLESIRFDRQGPNVDMVESSGLYET
jgi:hypothetical protein